jgi:hypothetical protein
MFENEFQNIIKYFPWFQRIILKTLILFLNYANKALWPIYKILLKKMFNYENMFLTDLKGYVEF